MKDKTIIVAGCTRSGLTLMMQILDKGGYPCFGEYPAYEGYEMGKIDWGFAKGKAVKLVDTQRQFPPKGEYYVIRMRRDLKQQAKSIIKFLGLCGIPVSRNDLKSLRSSLRKDYKTIDSWVARQEKHIYIDFENLLIDPAFYIKNINKVFGIDLSEGAKDCVVERDSDCFPGMLELSM